MFPERSSEVTPEIMNLFTTAVYIFKRNTQKENKPAAAATRQRRKRKSLNYDKTKKHHQVLCRGPGTVYNSEPPPHLSVQTSRQIAASTGTSFTCRGSEPAPQRGRRPLGDKPICPLPLKPCSTKRQTPSALGGTRHTLFCVRGVKIGRHTFRSPTRLIGESTAITATGGLACCVCC